MRAAELSASRRSARRSVISSVAYAHEDEGFHDMTTALLGQRASSQNFACMTGWPHCHQRHKPSAVTITADKFEQLVDKVKLRLRGDEVQSMPDETQKATGK
jgi:hypothetical protein